MAMDRSEATKQVYIETAKALKGSERRVCMAGVVKALGQDGQRQAARDYMGWRVAACAWMLMRFEGASGLRSSCRICWGIFGTLWTGKARPIPVLKAAACTPA